MKPPIPVSPERLLLSCELGWTLAHILDLNLELRERGYDSPALLKTEQQEEYATQIRVCCDFLRRNAPLWARATRVDLVNPRSRYQLSQTKQAIDAVRNRITDQLQAIDLISKVAPRKTRRSMDPPSKEDWDNYRAYLVTGNQVVAAEQRYGDRGKQSKISRSKTRVEKFTTFFKSNGSDELGKREKRGKMYSVDPQEMAKRTRAKTETSPFSEDDSFES